VRHASAALPGREPPEVAMTLRITRFWTRMQRVAATLSINYPFGACVVPGTGVE
jgi:hypothetical protein